MCDHRSRTWSTRTMTSCHYWYGCTIGLTYQLLCIYPFSPSKVPHPLSPPSWVPIQNFNLIFHYQHRIAKILIHPGILLFNAYTHRTAGSQPSDLPLCPQNLIPHTVDTLICPKLCPKLSVSIVKINPPLLATPQDTTKQAPQIQHSGPD